MVWKEKKNQAEMKKLDWWAAMLDPCLKRQYPLEASGTVPEHTTLPSLQLWCQTLCTEGPQTLLSKRTFFVFIWFAFCWTSEKNQLMTHAEKTPGLVQKRSQGAYTIGRRGRWMNKEKSKGREDIFLLQTHQWQSSLLKGTTRYPPVSLS